VSFVAVGSLRGSPGATTLALAVGAAWTAAGRRTLLVEADPDGGVLAARLGLGHHPCLTDLAVRARGGAHGSEIWDHTQQGRNGLDVVVGHPSADQCHATLRAGAGRIADLLDGLGEHGIVVDVGRLRPGSPAQPLIDTAALVLAVLRPRLEDVDGARPRLAALGTVGVDVAVVLVGEHPYRAAEVADVLGITVLGVVPDDERAARSLSGGGSRRTRRLPLLRAVAVLAADVTSRLERVGQP
jgi:MinD-like ATPase involved in chromosome partitioning or flagellar assembly